MERSGWNREHSEGRMARTWWLSAQCGQLGRRWCCFLREGTQGEQSFLWTLGGFRVPIGHPRGYVQEAAGYAS